MAKTMNKTIEQILVLKPEARPRMPKKQSPNSVRIRNSTAESLTFAYQTGGDGVEVRVQNGTIWLSQKNLGELFMTSSDNIGLHLKNIFKEGELNAASVAEEFSVTAKEFLAVRTEGKRLMVSNTVKYKTGGKQ